MRYLIGIDPGQNGGIAILDTIDLTLRAIRTPVFRPTKKNKLKRTTYDIDSLTSVFDISIDDVRCVGLERVNTMPGQGIASNGKLMYGFGLMHGLIAKFPHRLISPRVWKGYFKLSSDKDLSRTAASRLFLECGKEKLWHTKNRDGVAEASLITAYLANDMDLMISLEKVVPLYKTS